MPQVTTVAVVKADATTIRTFLPDGKKGRINVFRTDDQLSRALESELTLSVIDSKTARRHVSRITVPVINTVDSISNVVESGVLQIESRVPSIMTDTDRADLIAYGKSLFDTWVAEVMADGTNVW